MPRWNLLGGIDFGVSKLVDHIVVKQTAPLTPRPLLDKKALECMLHRMLNYIPAYKILLHVPIYAVMWNLTEPDTTPEKLSHAAALTQVFRYGGRLDKDEQGHLFYRFYHQEAEKQIRVNSVEQINQAMGLVNRYNLAGLVIDSLGEEDKRMWSVLDKHFSIGKIHFF